MRDAVRDESFVAFTREALPQLARLAGTLTGNPEFAKDLVQSTLEKAYRNWHRINPGDAPYAYVRRIMVNTHYDGWRSNSVFRRLFGHRDDDPPEHRDTGPTPDEVWQSKARIAEMLAPLTDKERAVITLRFLEDLSEADTAAELNIAPGTVKSTTSRALAKMRVNPVLQEVTR